MAGYERPTQTDGTDHYLYTFNSGGVSGDLYLQNKSADTPIYIRLGKHTLTVPSAADADVVLPANMELPYIMRDVSVQFLTTSYLDTLAIFRTPRS